MGKEWYSPCRFGRLRRESSEAQQIKGHRKESGQSGQKGEASFSGDEGTWGSSEKCGAIKGEAGIIVIGV